MSEKENKKITRAVFTARNIDCITCAFGIEKHLKKLDGVKSVGTAVMLNKIFIDYDKSKVDISEIMKAIDKAGYSNYLNRTETKS